MIYDAAITWFTCKDSCVYNRYYLYLTMTNNKLMKPIVCFDSHQLAGLVVDSEGIPNCTFAESENTSLYLSEPWCDARFPNFRCHLIYYWNVLCIFRLWICFSVFNKIWWVCLVPTSTTRFASDVGYRMAKIGLYREITFYEQWHLIP